MSKSRPHRPGMLLRYRSARSALKLIARKIEEAEPTSEQPRELLDSRSIRSGPSALIPESDTPRTLVSAIPPERQSEPTPQLARLGYRAASNSSTTLAGRGAGLARLGQAKRRSR
jgi:hypothetical protein